MVKQDEKPEIPLPAVAVTAMCRILGVAPGVAQSATTNASTAAAYMQEKTFDCINWRQTMVNMQCEVCGTVWKKDDSYKGMETRCPNCQGRCKCISDDELEQLQFECLECGLACSAETEKCPACGGKVAVRRTETKQAEAENSNKDFLKSWEENLGGYSFSLVISLTLTIMVCIFSFWSMPWTEIKSGAILWFAGVELVALSMFGICAVILLCLFFQRSRRLVKWLPSYFNILGSYLIVDFIGLILLSEITSTDLWAQINIQRVIMGAFWSFFWAWYFKRAFRTLDQ